jgi:hypothetical protein
MAQWGDELSTPSVLAGLAFGAALMTLLSACAPTPSRTPAQSSRAAADLLVYGVSGTGEKGQLEIDFGTLKIGEHSLREIRVCNAGDVWFLRSDIVFREPAGYPANWAGIWDDRYVVSGECLEWAQIMFAPTTATSFDGIIEVTGQLPRRDLDEASGVWYRHVSCDNDIDVDAVGDRWRIAVRRLILLSAVHSPRPVTKSRLAHQRRERIFLLRLGGL